MINAAVVGLGSFGKKRLDALIKNKNFSVVAINDVNKKLAYSLELSLGIKYKSIKNILNDKNISCIFICVPNSFHKKYIFKFGEKNKIIFCEKPFCKNINEAKKLYNFISKNKIRFQLGSNHRYFQSILYAQKLLKKENFGKILSITGRIGHDGERIYKKWFTKKKFSGGGTFVDNGSHLIDLVRLFVGDVKKKYFFGVNSYWKNINVNDNEICILSNKNNVLISLLSSWRLFSGYFFLEINCENGFINIDGRMDSLKSDRIFWKFKDYKKVKLIDFTLKKFSKFSYDLELDQFYNNIKSNKFSPNAIEALKIMKITHN
jgi:predicted dehydrogenase